MSHNYSFRAALAAAGKAAWQIEDVIGGDKRLDFDMPFLPESLARAEGLSFLGRAEKLALNQIRGHGYLYTFGLVEEFILPFVLDHARPRLAGDDYRVRALLQFASEEAKHIQLFKLFREEFTEGFGSACDVIGPPEAIARAVLAHHPLAVSLAILHIEWMTQRHFQESVRDAQDLDPQFKSLLRHHWMEEAQHAKLDVLMVEALAEACSESEIDTAIDEYMQIGELLDGGLEEQAGLDLVSLERATGRILTQDELAEFRRVQHQALRWTFLGSGMTHASFLETLEKIRPAARPRIEALAVALC